MPKKLNILFVVTRGAAEVDWILPILYVLSKKNLIYIVFNSEMIFNSVKKNIFLYTLLKKITRSFHIKKKNSNLILKFLKVIFHPLKNILFVSKILESINFKINNLEKFNNNFEKTKFNITLLEYATNSGISKFVKEKTKSKIVYFPSTTYPLNLKKNPFLKKIRLIGDHIIFNFDHKNYILPKIFKKKKIYNLENPKFQNWWIDKIRVKKIKKKNLKTVLFAYNSHFNNASEKEKIKLENQLMNTINILISIKDLNIIFKIHPVKNDPYYLNILHKFPKERWKISNDHLINLSNASDAVIAPSASAAILDGIASDRPTLELWNETNLVKQSSNKFSFKNNVKVQNLEQFKFYIKKALFNKSDIIWKKQKKIFGEYYNSRKNSSSHILKIFQKINN